MGRGWEGVGWGAKVGRGEGRKWFFIVFFCYGVGLEVCDGRRWWGVVGDMMWRLEGGSVDMVIVVVVVVVVVCGIDESDD